ncbi:MAG: HlyD family efflux transporter periplasmic adaptor subunit [Mesorhizobium sp.]|nr:HlyD family efflux transporter periplasmic adaptor subunit [Mesorhizobium sp.]MBL8576838.1 HlyD family efflux transporter periplasmic adaptor subunit [Mesorhizobium sp.]
MSILCSLPFAASLFTACAGPSPLAVGYVEGDFVLLAPIEVAQVEQLSVKRGDRVEAGATVAEMETDDARIAVSQAEAALAQAEAQLANLLIGKRPEEIAVLEAMVLSAKAEAEEKRRTLARIDDLLKRGTATQAAFDSAQTAVEVAAAQINQTEANLAVGKLPARPEEIKAAESAVKQAQTALDQARWRLSKRSLTAPAPGRVDDVIRNPGDVASPSAPVISMLPDGAVKLSLFVPEPSFSKVEVGKVLNVRCDGCPDGLQARISYVSPDPEFTPPVIYSLETRQKLVYLVEARPIGDASPLQPGQIVDVELVNGE